MYPYPHLYRAAAAAAAAGNVTVTSPSLPALESASPPEFDGPGGVWSPETLLCAAVADCFVLTFRAVARAANLPWVRLECRVEGTLDRIDRTTRFTHFVTHAALTVPAGTDAAAARSALERAERGCLIANSLNGERRLAAEVVAA
jgi:organic hydroperoxide reductase OsmC/OhrA